jgi:hypothetical protein
MTLDPKAVHEKMLELENSDEDRTAAGAVAQMLGVSEAELIDAVTPQINRTQILCREHYTPKVAVLPNSQQMFVAMMQGITFAVAVLELNVVEDE